MILQAHELQQDDNILTFHGSRALSSDKDSKGALDDLSTSPRHMGPRPLKTSEFQLRASGMF